MAFLSLLFMLLACFRAQAAADTDGGAPVVTTASGEVRGAVQHTNDLPDKPVYTFLGIPYAAPPVGDLRFRPPQPAVPWEGVWDGTKLGAYCPQGPELLQIMPFTFPHENFSEDCLTLNVETPAVEKDSGLPVLLWIHGGGLSVGMGYAIPFTGLVAHQDVVVVTFNYRLGALGFLSTGDENAPGNVGFLDQTQAMVWVKENIRNFGGDPDRVTLFGESAGGVSVGYHVVSPHSKGLFRRAISQSGTVYTMMEVNKKPLQLANRLAEEVDCDVKDAVSMLACLRQKTADDIVEGVGRMLNLYAEDQGDREYFTPVIEETFLPAHPDELYNKGQTNAVDYLLGVNNHEYGYIMPSMMHPNFGQGMTEDTFLLEIKKLMGRLYPRSSVDDLAAAAREVYEKPDDPMAIQHQFTLCFGDQMFVAPTVHQANKHAASGYKVFLYENHYSLSSAAASRPAWVGCDHGEDYFVIPGAFFLDLPLKDGSMFPSSPEDKNASLGMMAYWANFARTGNPSDPSGGPPDSPAVPEWPQYTPDNPAYINLDLTSSADVGLHPERMALWNDVIPKLAAVSERDEL